MVLRLRLQEPSCNLRPRQLRARGSAHQFWRSTIRSNDGDFPRASRDGRHSARVWLRQILATPRIRTEPPTIRVGPNVRVSDSHSRDTHYEVVIAAHPRDASRLIAASIVYPEGVASYGTIVYESSDGGSTWSARADCRGLATRAIQHSPTGRTVSRTMSRRRSRKSASADCCSFARPTAERTGTDPSRSPTWIASTSRSMRPRARVADACT